MDVAVQSSPRYRSPNNKDITYYQDLPLYISYQCDQADFLISPKVRVEISPKKFTFEPPEKPERNRNISREYLIKAEKNLQAQRKKKQDREQMMLKFMIRKEEEMQNKIRIRSLKQERQCNLNRKRADMYYLKKNDALKVKREAYIAEKYIEANERAIREQNCHKRYIKSLSLIRGRQISELRMQDKEKRRRRELVKSLNSEYELIQKKKEEISQLKQEEESISKDLDSIIELQNIEYKRLKSISVSPYNWLSMSYEADRR